MTSQGPNVLLMLTNMNMDQMMMPFMAGYRNCKRANPWKNETSSKRQCLKRAGGEVPGESAVLSNGAVPGESAVLSNGAVPGESAVLSQGAVPGESAAKLASESGEPGASRTRTVHHRSPKQYDTPAVLQKLAPPHCAFVLDQNLHRFYFRFRKEGNVWQDHFGHPRHMSKAFQNLPWRDALKQVHKGAWDRWNLVREQDEWKISNPSLVQTPGCIPEDILEVLDEFIQSMPAPVKYIKMA